MENKVKIWSKEISCCKECNYVEDVIDGFENAYMYCRYAKINLSNETEIYKDCPFAKPISKEVIEGFGFKYDNDSETFKLHKEYEMYELELANTVMNIEHFYQTKLIAKQLPFLEWKSFNIFNGEVNNPIELEFILKSVGVIE